MNVISMNRGPVDPINNNSFAEAIQEAIPATTNTIMRIGRMSSLNVAPPVVSVVDVVGRPLGLVADPPVNHCEPGHPKTVHGHVETSKEFPLFLRTLPEVGNDTRALRLAASYAVAYGMFIAATADGRSVIRNGSSTLRDEMWTPTYRRDEIDTRRTMPHRFAGVVALRANGMGKGIRSLDDHLPPSGLPAHIAGIINPLSHEQVVKCYTVFDNNGKWSRAPQVQVRRPKVNK